MNSNHRNEILGTQNNIEERGWALQWPKLHTQARTSSPHAGVERPHLSPFMEAMVEFLPKIYFPSFSSIQ